MTNRLQPVRGEVVIAVVDAALVALGLRVREAEEALARAPHFYTVSTLSGT